MEWVIEVLKEPGAIVGVAGLLAGLVGLSVRGAKAKFTDEIKVVIDEKLTAHEKVQRSRDDLVDTRIASLQADVTEVKTDVRGMNVKLDKILSNGFFPHKEE